MIYQENQNDMTHEQHLESKNQNYEVDMNRPDNERRSVFYPQVSPLVCSHDELPANGRILADLSIPVGFLVTPFILTTDCVAMRKDPPRLTDINGRVARCTRCAAYINPLCEVTSIKWLCSLCGTKNFFPKSTLRFRQVDIRYLPEMQNFVMDYPLPLLEDTREVLHKQTSPMYCLAKDRPLVHVIMIQESMPLSCIVATIDALTAALSILHSDIKIVLMTFSNRIGIFRFSKRGDKQHVCIQYVHFGVKIDNNLVVLDGNDSIDQQEEIRPLLNIEDIGDFLDVAVSMNLCRQSVEEALSYLLDASPSSSEVTSQLVLIGPTLEALIKWITCKEDNEQQQPTHYFDESVIHPNVKLTPGLSGLSGILAGLGLIDKDRQLLQGKLRVKRDSAIEKCSGIIIHLIVSNPQDICVGTHESAAVDPQNRSKLNKAWVEKLAIVMQAHDIGFNVWGLADYDSSQVGLIDLLPLVQATGGNIFRFSFGTSSLFSTQQFALQFSQLISAPVATKCLLRGRASPSVIDSKSSKMNGHCAEDPEMPGIYHIAACNHFSTFSFPLYYKAHGEENPGSFSEERTNYPKDANSSHIVVQIAFSYNLLVQDDQEDYDSEGNVIEKVSPPCSPDDESRTKLGCGAENYHNKTFTDLRDDITNKILSAVMQQQSHDENHNNMIKTSTWSNFEESPYTLYSPSKRLIAARRLRVITVLIECTAKIPRIIKCMNPSVVAALLIHKSLSRLSFRFLH